MGVNKKLLDIQKSEATALQAKDTISAQKLYQEYKVVDSLKALLAKNWAVTHPNSTISSYILYQDVRGRISLNDLEASLNDLGSKAKANSYAGKLQAQIESKKATALGKIAPDFTQTDTAGNPVSLKDFRGRNVLLDFWVSWCIACRAENPNLVFAYKK